MELSLYLAHLLSIALILLTLIIKIFVSGVKIKNVEFQKAFRRWTRYVDWPLIVVLVGTGLYMAISTGRFQFYHLLKIITISAFIYYTRLDRHRKYVYSLVLGLFFFLLAGAATGLKPAWPQMSAEETGRTGKEVFGASCSPCHGEDGRLGKFGAIDLTQTKLSLPDKREVVTSGRTLTVMRSFSKELSPAEIDSVLQYIETLK